MMPRHCRPRAAARRQPRVVDPRPPERELQDRLIEAGRLSGWLVYHTHDSRKSEAGFPDLVMVRDGVLLAVECKRGPAELRAMPEEQQAWLAALGEVPGVATIVTTPENEGRVLEWITAPRRAKKV